MKVLSLAACLVLPSISAFAFPAVGDKTVLRYSEGADHKVVGTQTLEVLSVNPAGAQFTFRETYAEADGTETVDEDQDSPAEILSFMKSADSEAACTEFGLANQATTAVLEKIEVLGKTINTCHVRLVDEDDVDEMWFGDVAFGLIKEYEHDSDPANNGYVDLIDNTLH